MSPSVSVLFTLLLTFALASPVMAALPYASTAQDRKAKQAIPPNGKTLVYIYRTRDGGPAESAPVSLNGRLLGPLGADTYYLVEATPGRVVLTAGPKVSSLTMQCREGRICFVHLTANSAGGGGAQQVSYGAGRQAVQRAHLLRASAPAPVAKSSTPAAPGDGSMAFIVKAGRFSLASDSQTILAAVHNFDAGTSYGLEGEWRSAQGLAFGLEVLSHAYDYTVGVSGGTATANLVMVNAKQYFRTGQTAQPYIGAGLGGVSVEFSGATTGSAGGYALQAMTGVVFQWEHVGLYTEIKYQKAEAQDSAGQTVDASGLGLYTGLIVRF